MAEAEHGCLMPRAATTLCNEWKSAFPGDEERIASIRALIEKEEQILGCH
jgi:hypothetical protein